MEATHKYFQNWIRWREELAGDIDGKLMLQEVEIKEEFSCDFPKHSAASIREDPSIKNDLLIEDMLGIRFNSEKKPMFLSTQKLEDILLSEDLRGADPKTDKKLVYNDPMNTLPGNCFQGFLVVRGGTLAKDSQHASMGFCIQRVDVRNFLSEFTKGLHKEYNIREGATPKIVGCHNYYGIHVMHTSTFIFLSKNFGWDKKPEILHALLFKSELYERDIVEKLLEERKSVIQRLENCLPEEVHALSNLKMVLKLILNGSKLPIKNKIITPIVY